MVPVPGTGIHKIRMLQSFPPEPAEMDLQHFFYEKIVISLFNYLRLYVIIFEVTDFGRSFYGFPGF